MSHLTRNDYAAALRLIEALQPAASDVLRFACEAVAALGDFVASELTTLSVCDLVAGHRQVVDLDHAIAVPLYTDGRTLVSFVLNRRGLDFSERERERLELLRPHLAFLYAHAVRAGAEAHDGAAPLLRPAAPGPLPPGLTPREGEVMHWLARGKTDADIAALLAISPRTVHKHLEHIYVKLGVENRTAAVMRALAAARPDGSPPRGEAVEAALRGGR